MEVHRLFAIAVAAILVSGCGDGSPPPPVPPSLVSQTQPDWTLSRHRDGLPILLGEETYTSPVVLIGEGQIPGSIHTPATPPAVTTAPNERTVIVLCNVDDDDGDGQADNQGTEVDDPSGAGGSRDTDDLTLVVLRKMRDATGHDIRLELLPTQSDPLSTMDVVRVFDAKGEVRLGRSATSTCQLTPQEKGSLENEDLHLYVEGCRFGACVRLQASRDGLDISEITLLVAPLLLALPGSSVQEIMVCTRDSDRVETFVGKLQEYCDIATDPHDRLSAVDLDAEDLTRDYWIRDELFWGYTRTPFVTLPVAIHTPRGGGLAPWVERRLGPDVGYWKPVEPAGPGTTNLTYGGNVAVAPSADGISMGRICAGLHEGDRTLSERSKSVLEEYVTFMQSRRFQPLLNIQTWWLYVGHVDEVVAFVPRTDGSTAMLIASPKEGCRLLNALCCVKVPSPHTEMCDRLIVDDIRDNYTWGDVLASTATTQVETTHEVYNQELDQLIFGQSPDRDGGIVGEILAAFAEAGVSPPDRIEVPAFFRQMKNTANNCYQAAALIPNMVNLIEVDGHLIVPDPLLPSFKTAMEGTLMQNSIQGASNVHWVDTFHHLHSGGGNIHCATSQRHNPPATPWWLR